MKGNTRYLSLLISSMYSRSLVESGCKDTTIFNTGKIFFQKKFIRHTNCLYLTNKTFKLFFQQASGSTRKPTPRNQIKAVLGLMSPSLFQKNFAISKYHSVFLHVTAYSTRLQNCLNPVLSVYMSHGCKHCAPRCLSTSDALVHHPAGLRPRHPGRRNTGLSSGPVHIHILYYSCKGIGLSAKQPSYRRQLQTTFIRVIRRSEKSCPSFE